MKRALDLGCIALAAIVMATMGTPVAPPAASSVQVVALRTEYQQNPLGIDAPNPRLSWQLAAKARAVTQTAYQVRVASSARALA